MRRIASRILLVALALAAGVAVYRVAAGSRGDAFVSLEGLHPNALAHESFRLSSATRLVVDAAGSFEEQPDTSLAALGWIVRRPDGAVVWRQRPGAHPARGLVSAVRDTLELEPGDYDAYFASFGDPVARAAAAPGVGAEPSLRARIREALSQGGLAWQGEAGRWHLRVAPAAAEDRFNGTTLSDVDLEPAPDSALVWTTGALGSDATPSTLLRVSRPAEVEIDAVLEAVNGAVADSAALVRATAPYDTLWAFAARGSTWAGGATKNRRSRARLRLAPGLYRLAARTDGAHAAGDWTANPPWAPWSWGVRLRRASGPTDAVSVFDAAGAAADADAGRLPEIVGVRCVGPDETWEARFTLAAPTEALLVAQGEVSGSSLYDYATLFRDGAELWRMTTDATQPAGGAERNRRAEALLALAPGSYTLTFETDGSHDCRDGFGDDPPDDPSLWGAVLIALDPAFDPATVRREEPTRAPSPSAGETSDDSDGTSDGAPAETLIDFARVGNSARLESAFTLDGPSQLQIAALGEFFPGEALDYGWVEDARGTRVWAMTRGSSSPAGGASQNRRVEQTIVLPAGRYTAHYVTNGSHAFGDFGGGAPDEPDAWGLRIDRVGSE